MWFFVLLLLFVIFISWCWQIRSWWWCEVKCCSPHFPHQSMLNFFASFLSLVDGWAWAARRMEMSKDKEHRKEILFISAKYPPFLANIIVCVCLCVSCLLSRCSVCLSFAILAVHLTIFDKLSPSFCLALSSIAIPPPIFIAAKGRDPKKEIFVWTKLLAI